MRIYSKEEQNDILFILLREYLWNRFLTLQVSLKDFLPEIILNKDVFERIGLF